MLGVVNMLFYGHGYVYDTLDGTVGKSNSRVNSTCSCIGYKYKGFKW